MISQRYGTCPLVWSTSLPVLLTTTSIHFDADTEQFAKEGHPGGSSPIHRAAGHDATSIFKPLHPPGTIENGLDPECYKGNVDPATMPVMSSKKAAGEEIEGERKIDLSEIIGLPDFDVCPLSPENDLLETGKT
jgi:hypothetical protein